MPCLANQLLLPGAPAALTASLAKYSTNYEQVFDEVHQRLQSNGHATMIDLAGLIGWKHVQNAPWMHELYVLPSGTVQATTATAFAPELADAQRVAALGGLPGYRSGGAFTSVLLTAWDPSTFGVFDTLANGVRSHVVDAGCGCNWDDLPTYFEHLRRLALELSGATGTPWTPRQEDMTMFILGGGK